MATFTKLYLGATPALYTPATIRGAWDDTAGAVTRGLVQVKTDGATVTTVARAETNVGTTWDVLLYRGVSGTLAAQTISGTVNVVIGALESSATADFFWHVHLYVTSGDTDTPRGTLLTDYVESTTNEWPTTATGTALQSAQTLASLAIAAGDRLVVELGYIARNSVATSFTGTLNYGTLAAVSGAVLGDLTGGSTNVTGLAGSLQFSAAITETTAEGRVSQAAIELITRPVAPEARVTQHVIEVLGTASATSAPLAASTSLTLATTALLSLSATAIPLTATSSVRLGTAATLSLLGPLRVTQAAAELFLATPATARTTQLAVEVFYPTIVVVRLTQLPVEYYHAGAATIRVTQEPVEVFLVPQPRRLIRRLRRAPHVADAHRRIAYAKFALDLQRGVGALAGQGASPVVTLRVSRDGGRTWGEPITMRAGALGAYTTRVLARRLGQARDAVFEVTVSDPVAWSLVQAWLDLEPGTS